MAKGFVVYTGNEQQKRSNGIEVISWANISGFSE
jgi:hypothetical protein